MQLAGSCYFALNSADPSPLVAPAISLGTADPSPLVAPAISLGSADPLSSTAADPSPNIPSARTPSLYCRGPPLSVGADPPPPSSVTAEPLYPAARTPSHHNSIVRQRGPPLAIATDPLFSTAAEPSKPLRHPSERTPSFQCRARVLLRKSRAGGEGAGRCECTA
ncbi:hypothetical protein niasHT_024072 [Heterodera trifolii]|uniref:Uncharacterized protein n=1 Tax=Heterodera trifolii TaxID=157864 RepID=A0ABD2JYQ1_9BILA